jgi:hypothetical protein
MIFHVNEKVNFYKFWANPQSGKLASLMTIPQIFTRVRGPLATSAHEVDTTQVRVMIGFVFVKIVIESETYYICRAVLLTI